MITYENENGICKILFDRPEKKNAITLDMYQLIADYLDLAAEDSSVKVVVLGSTSENFTAGNDLADFLANPGIEKDSPVGRFLEKLIHCPLPIIAAIEGFAVGIGCTLLLHCERVIASKTAKLSFPFVNLGLVPEAGSSLLLPRLVGYQKAADIFLTGDAFSAEDAEKWGVVSQVTETGQALDSALIYAEKLAQKSRTVLIETKRLIRLDEQPLEERVDIELQSFSESLKSPAAVEAMTAFMEKRKPDFSNL